MRPAAPNRTQPAALAADAGSPSVPPQLVLELFDAVRWPTYAAAKASKQSMAALFDLFDRYRELSPDERAFIDRLLADDLQSDDEGSRFDSLAIIDEFRIASALPALRALAARLETATGPGALYEWEKVNGII